MQHNLGLEQPEIDVLLKQLEVGLPSTVIDLLEIPIPLTRGEYLNLAGNGLLNLTQMWAASPELLSKCLGEARAKELERFRPK